MISPWLFALVLTGGSQQDVCRTLLPAGLAVAIGRQLPGYRLPRASDNHPEAVRDSMEHGGRGCLGVATGDFDGDGRKDVALLLTSRRSVWLTVALARSGSWRIERIQRAGEASYRARLYVETEPPGKYENQSGGELKRGEVRSFISHNDVVVSGATESTGIAFMWRAKGWVHVWVSD